MIPDRIDFKMRGGDNPIPEFNVIEKRIAEQAYNKVNTNASWNELGYKRAYNFIHTLTFYMTRDRNIQKLLFKYAPYPEYLEMEVTQVCPFKCTMCEHTYWDEKNTVLTFDKFKHAMDQFPNLKWAGNNALGDPFTNPEYMKMLHYLDDKGVIQEIYTNLGLITPSQIEEFVLMKGYVFFKISIEASYKELYEKIRVGVDFDKVVEKIKLFDNLKRKHGRHYPELQFHYIVMKNNMDDAMNFIDFVDDLDVSCTNIVYSRLLHNFKEIDYLYTDVPMELGNKLVQRGKDLNIRVTFNADAFTKPPARECTAWLMPYMFPDGTVISCCCMNEQNRRDWQRSTRMGNIFEKPFREIWRDKPYTQLIHKLSIDKPLEAHPVCDICNIYDVSYCKKGKK